MNKKIGTLAFLVCLIASVFTGLWAQTDSPVERKVVVQAWGTSARISAWEKRGDQWEEVFRAKEGYVGRNGVTDQKMEGDGCTPVGEFEVRRAFGIAPAPKTALPYTQVQEGDEWVDDSSSKYYNQYVKAGSVDKDWFSSEKLITEDVAYQYALVVEYNTDPAVPGRGSAIFFHCSLNRPTSGCVSTPQDDMIKFLEFLRPGDKIIIEEAK